jgi:hypothetical protein
VPDSDSLVEPSMKDFEVSEELFEGGDDDDKREIDE